MGREIREGGDVKREGTEIGQCEVRRDEEDRSLRGLTCMNME